MGRGPMLAFDGDHVRGAAVVVRPHVDGHVPPGKLHLLLDLDVVSALRQDLGGASL
jgi:hypothetical protein